MYCIQIMATKHGHVLFKAKCLEVVDQKYPQCHVNKTGRHVS